MGVPEGTPDAAGDPVRPQGSDV